MSRYYEKCNIFEVAGESDYFRLRVSKFSETTGDDGMGLSNHNGMKFSTKDKNNDNWRSGDCAGANGGIGGIILVVTLN